MQMGADSIDELAQRAGEEDTGLLNAVGDALSR